MMGPMCLALPLLLAGPTPLPENWSAYISKPGRFEVGLPGKAIEKKQSVKTASGQTLQVAMVVAEGRNDALFVVSYTDYADADLKKGSVQKRLDQARDGAATSAGGKAVKESKIELKGHPGRDFCIDKNGMVAARVHIYLVKNRLYQVMVLGPAPAAEARTFLDSFRLIE